MSSEVIYKCDHCGAKCPGDEYASIGRWDEPGTIIFGKTVHGCSKEHLGIALAKMFGIGINGETDELLNRKRRELTKLADANNFLIIERDNMHDRVAELEKRIAKLTAPVTVDGKTPGQVGFEGYRDARHKATGEWTSWEHELAAVQRDWWGSSALAVLRAFGQPSQTTQDTVEVLRRVRERIDSNPYPDVRSLRHIDDELAKLEAKPAQSPPDTSTESGLPDPVIAAITLPTKPTKPLSLVENCTICGCPNERAFLELCRGDAKHNFEVINDPR